jgi:hypothetical protein
MEDLKKSVRLFKRTGAGYEAGESMNKLKAMEMEETERRDAER